MAGAKPLNRTAFNRSVYILGLVSFLTDCSAEMIYPLLPVFLSQELGATAIALGAIEGVAESTAAFFKMLAGHWADRQSRRKPLVVFGYGLATLARPLIGLMHSWVGVMSCRFVDRIGKGIRTTPRDALLADVTTPETRGRAYGIHRASDHAGAVCGPLIAGALLLIPGMELRRVFLLAAIPGVLAVTVLLVFLKEQSVERTPTKDTPREDWFTGLKRMGPRFHWVLMALFLFTLGNSTDAFLLLRLAQDGVSAQSIALLWSLHHVVRVLATYWGGTLADRVGRQTMIGAGWLFYSAIYVAFALPIGKTALIGVFLAYGIYFGLTEPAERAWIAEEVPESMRGRAFGYYHFVVGIAALPSSLLFGWIWYTVGISAAFLTGAVLALLSVLALLARRFKPVANR